MGNDYNEDDVVEVDGKPGRIVRCGIWSTTFFTYDVREGIIVGGAKLVVQNDKLKDLKIEKPLPLLDLSKYKVDSSCQDLLTELTRILAGSGQICVWYCLLVATWAAALDLPKRVQQPPAEVPEYLSLIHI